MLKSDVQWWAGAIGGGLIAMTAVVVGHHPYDVIIGGIAAFLMAFSAYKITPSGSVKL